MMGVINTRTHTCSWCAMAALCLANDLSFTRSSSAVNTSCQLIKVHMCERARISNTSKSGDAHALFTRDLHASVLFAISGSGASLFFGGLRVGARHVMCYFVCSTSSSVISYVRRASNLLGGFL